MSTENPDFVYLEKADRLARKLGTASRSSKMQGVNYLDLEAMQKGLGFEPSKILEYRGNEIRWETRKDMWPKFGFVFAGQDLLEVDETGGSGLTDAIRFLHQTVTQSTHLIVHMEDAERAKSIYEAWDAEAPKEGGIKVPNKADVSEDLHIRFRKISYDGLSDTFAALKRLVTTTR